MTETLTMDNQAELISDLREKFFKKLDEDGPPDSNAFHPADVARITDQDDWLRRFLEHNDFRLDESLKMLWDTCEWRRKFGTNDITLDNVRRDYLEDGVCYSYGHDKDGKKLFIVKSKLHTKGSRDFSELQRCVVYWFERLEREGNGSQISIFFDMAEAGLSNLDMEFTKYLIGLFKCYYPHFLNLIIIYEMPWVLNAAFNIIKSWLPAKAVPKIKFVKKSNIKEYVDLNVALKSWGGKSEYSFKFIPEDQVNGAVTNGKVDNNKKVHFAENSPMTEQPTSGFGDQTKNEEKMISIEPDVLVFNKEGNEVVGTITLKNITSDKCLSYKIKTTSPEKFRVRPSIGILMSSQQCVITVVLQPGFNLRGLLHNDRFLVMCLPMKDTQMTTQELAEFWKTVGKEAEQHRLVCREGSYDNVEILKSNSNYSISGSSVSDRSLEGLFSKINRLEDRHNRLYNEIIALKRMLLISVILIISLSICICYILRVDITTSLEQENHRIYDYESQNGHN